MMTNRSDTATTASPGSNASRLPATIALTGFGLFVVIMSAFHFIQPELNPLTRFGSEYVAGRAGWLMNLAFFCFAGGLFSIAYAFRRGLTPPARSRAGEILLLLAGAGILGSGIFDAHLQGDPIGLESELHSVAGLLAFVTLIPATIVYSRRLRSAGRLKGRYRYLRPLSWAVALFFLASLFLFGPLQLVGLGQRLFLSVLFAWLILATRGLQTGAFRSGPDTGD